MSFRGTPRGRGVGSSSRGGGSFRGGGRGSFQQSYGPPATVQELGAFVHACEAEMVCESINPKIPYFNAPIYLENKTTIGKVDEVFGPLNQVYFTVKPQEGIVATSFKAGDKVYIGGDKLLPLEKFLPKPKPPPGTPKPKRAGGRSRATPGRGSRGSFRGPSSRGTSRGGAPRGRGSFGDRGGRGVSRGSRGGQSFASRGGFSRGSGNYRGSR